MASKGPVFKVSSSKGEKINSDVLLSDLETNFIADGQTVVNGTTAVTNEINGEDANTTTSASVKSSSSTTTTTTTTSDSSICVVNGESSQEVNDV